MSAVDLAYAAAWRGVRMLPEPVAAGLFRGAADYAFRKNGKGTQRLRANLRRVVGPDVPESDLDTLVRDGLRSYARYWMEAFRLPSRSHEQVLKSFQILNVDVVVDVMARGKGLIFALPHAANWDIAGAWMVANGWPLVAVAERLKPEAVFERFVAYRESIGLEIVPLTGGDRPPMDVLVDRANKGHVVALLADRDLSARGVEVSFFGGRTRMPAGPALVALRTEAPLYVVNLWNEKDRSVAELLHVEKPGPEVGTLDKRVRAMTQTIADLIATSIAQHPQDWHMLQRMWLDQPAPERARAAAPGRSAPRAEPAPPAEPAEPPEARS